MRCKLYNLAKMTVSGTPGAGTITLGAAVAGFLTFAQAGVGNGELVGYAILDGANCETGTGTYTSSGTTLSRDTVDRSSGTSNTGKISATSAAIVIITAPADVLGDDLIGVNYYASSQTITIPTRATRAFVKMIAASGGIGSAGGTSAANSTLASGSQTISTLTCNGSAGTTTAGGAGGAVSTGGDFNVAGFDGDLAAGAQASSQFGAGYGAGVVNNLQSSGSGSYLEKLLTGLTPGNTLTLTLGAAGTGSGGGSTTGKPGLCAIRWYA